MKSEITDRFRDSLMQTLKGLCDKFEEETGEQILIGVGFTNGEEMEECVVSSNRIEYGDACKMVVGITSIVSDGFSCGEEKW